MTSYGEGISFSCQLGDNIASMNSQFASLLLRFDRISDNRCLRGKIHEISKWWVELSERIYRKIVQLVFNSLGGEKADYLPGVPTSNGPYKL